MFVYKNNSNQNHKKTTHTPGKVSTKRSAKVKTTSSKRKSHKQGKSLHKKNAQFLKALGFLVRKNQKTK